MRKQIYLYIIAILKCIIPKVTTFEPGCSKPLGLMTGTIKDWQLSSNSERENDSTCRVKFARLHSPGSYAWCGSNNHRDSSKNHPWILIDLGVRTELTGIITQGRGNVQEWVTMYNLATSLDTWKWEWIKDFSGRKMMFRGNKDSHHPYTNWFDRPATTRFVRVHIIEWHAHPALRMELLGCQECAETISGLEVGTSLSTSSHSSWVKKFSCEPDDANIFGSRAWCSKINNAHQWLQFNVGPPHSITGIITQGRGDSTKRQWVTSYKVSYSNDTNVWYFYNEPNHYSSKIFGGNMDKSIERRHYFNSPFVAKFIRIHPVTWHNSISMRVGLLGCKTKECPVGYFRINEFLPCFENIAFKKEVWTNDKKHFWKDLQYGHASLAVDGIESNELTQCAILDNYYTEFDPVWMVDLNENYDVSGVIIKTWQGNGKDKETSYHRDYLLDIEKLSVYISHKPRLSPNELQFESSCGTISRTNGNNALFQARLRFNCGSNSLRGKYVYVTGSPTLSNRNVEGADSSRRIFQLVLCEVYVYKS